MGFQIQVTDDSLVLDIMTKYDVAIARIAELEDSYRRQGVLNGTLTRNMADVHEEAEKRVIAAEKRVAELEKSARDNEVNNRGYVQAIHDMRRSEIATLESQIAESRLANLDAQQKRIAAEERVKDLEAEMAHARMGELQAARESALLEAAEICHSYSRRQRAGLPIEFDKTLAAMECARQIVAEIDVSAVKP